MKTNYFTWKEEIILKTRDLDVVKIKIMENGKDEIKNFEDKEKVEFTDFGK